MLLNHTDRVAKAAEIVTELSDHALTKSHARHLSAEKCKSIGLNATMLEDDPRLQDAVLTVHHACVHTLSATATFKMIENHKGVAFLQMAQQQILLQAPANADQPALPPTAPPADPKAEGDALHEKDA
jgi:hypothetical protein